MSSPLTLTEYNNRTMAFLQSIGVDPSFACEVTLEPDQIKAKYRNEDRTSVRDVLIKFNEHDERG